MMVLIIMSPLYLQHDRCVTHEDDLKYWCCDCSVALCVLCLNTSSHLDHKVLLANQVLQDKKTELGDLVEDVKQQLKKQQEQVWANLSTVCRTSCRHLHQLHNINTDVTKVLYEVNEASTIDKVLPY